MSLIVSTIYLTNKINSPAPNRRSWSGRDGIMTKPTPEQEAFLKEFYRMYSRYHLAVKLGITNKQLTELLNYLGLKKKKDAKKTMLTDEQKEFINENFIKMTHEKLAEQLFVTPATVRNYCFRKGLKKNGKDKFTSPPKEIIRYSPPETPAIERPKGEYSSGYEATIEKYLKD
jgi:hypothetical protein